VPALTAKQSFDAPIAEISGLPDGAAAPTAVIRWGGGAINVVQATPLSGSPGQFVAWAPHTYRRAGARIVSVVFRDHGKVLGRVHERVTVGKPSVTPSTPSNGGPLPLPSDHQPGVTSPAVAGTRWEGVLGTVSFPQAPSDTADLSGSPVRIEWGDGTFSPGQLSRVGSNQFQILGAHTYAAPGTYAVNVVTNYEGYPLISIPGQPLPLYAIYPSEYAGLDTTLQVSGAPTTLPPPSVQITGQTLPTAYAAHFSGTLATMTGISPDPFAPSVYAVVDWGNGSAPSANNAWVQYQNGQYVVTGDIGFPNFGNTGAADHSGSYDLTVTLMLNDHDDPTKNTVLGSVTEHLVSTAIVS
jgi:hypothetical protein